MSTIAALPPMPGKGKAKTPKHCACGCAGMTKGGAFIPGHDSRRLGWAMRIAGGHDTTGITSGEQAAAEALIKANATRSADKRDPRLTDTRTPAAATKAS